jgi:hypothetical protein
LTHYQSAIDILNLQRKGKGHATGGGDDIGDDAEIKNNIVRALIGMVEIWMDPSYDLWQVLLHSNILYFTIDFAASNPMPKKTAKNYWALHFKRTPEMQKLFKC